jgi:hypothetical protein
LAGKLRELRFFLKDRPIRVAYWIAPERRIVLLTVFPLCQPFVRQVV